MSKNKLDQKHTIFIHEYFYGVSRGNAEECARRAGWASTTARKKSASWVGKSRQNSTNKALWDLVDAERRKISEGYGITEQDIMNGYKRDAAFDPRKLLDEDGNVIINLQDLDDDTALALAGFEIDEKAAALRKKGGKGKVLYRKVKFKFPDKKGNRDSMAKIKGMFAKDNAQKGIPFDEFFEGLKAVSPELAERIREKLLEARKNEAANK